VVDQSHSWGWFVPVVSFWAFLGFWLGMFAWQDKYGQRPTVGVEHVGKHPERVSSVTYACDQIDQARTELERPRFK
jgi:hypothetical protein